MIRSTVTGDLLNLVQLETLSFPDPWSQTGLSELLLQPASLSLVAEDPGAELPITGYLLIRLAGSDAELLRIAVHPDRRLEGIGRSLLEAAVTALEHRRVERCFLEVRADNQAAIALYGRFPARQVSRRASYYRDGTEALVLSLEIAQRNNGSGLS